MTADAEIRPPKVRKALRTRFAFVVRVGEQFIGPRHMHRALVSFEKAELFRYRAAAKRIAYARKADEIMSVKITLEETYES